MNNTDEKQRWIRILDSINDFKKAKFEKFQVQKLVELELKTWNDFYAVENGQYKMKT